MTNFVKKFISILLFALPFMALAVYALASFRSGSSLPDIQTALTSFFESSLQVVADTPFGSAYISITNMVENSIGVSSPYVHFAFSYLAYAFVVELVFVLFDLILFVPRKCRDIFK